MRKLSRIRLQLLLITVFLLSLLLSPSINASNRIGVKAVEIAKSEIGLHEIGENRGVEIDRINKQVGSPLGSQWCMAKVYDWVERACKSIGVKNPLKRTGRCATQLKYANSIGSGLKVIPNGIGMSRFLKSGDIMIHSVKGTSETYIGKDWSGHTGLVEIVNPTYAKAIEGNTNYAGSRDGGSVQEKNRKYNYFIAVIRMN